MIRAVSYRLLKLHQASPTKDGTNTNKIGFPIEKRNLPQSKFGKKECFSGRFIADLSVWRQIEADKVPHNGPDDRGAPGESLIR